MDNKDVSGPYFLTACRTYYTLNSAKVYCFNDLRKNIPKLLDEQKTEFIDYVLRSSEEMTEKVKDESKAVSATDRCEPLKRAYKLDQDAGPFQGVIQINALKIEYCFRLFSVEPAARGAITDFARRCLVAFHDIKRPDQDASQSIVETQPSDDLCLLAAMSLLKGSDHQLRTAENKSPSHVLICAAAIIEHLLQKSPHNYHALLLLVRIYLLLGAGSLAMKTFSKLSVKQMQFETVSHNLYTRLSTIHPHAAPATEGTESKDYNPQSALTQILSFYRHADATSTRSQTSGLDHGSYVNVEGALDLQKRLNQSICRRMSAIEARRMQRLVGGEPTGRYEEIGQSINFARAPRLPN